MPPSLDDFETIYRNNHAAVWRFLLHLGVSRNDVADVTHNVFSIAYRKLSTFEQRSTIRTWLCSIAFRVARDLRRSAAARLEVTMSDPTAAAASSSSNTIEASRHDGLLALAERLLDALPEDQRAVFVLHELEEMTGHEIAALMGTPLGTVRSRLRRARASFRKQLADLGQAGALSSLIALSLPSGADAAGFHVLEHALCEQLRAAQPPLGAIEQGWSALVADLSAPAIGATAASGMKAFAGIRSLMTLAAGVAVTTGVLWTGSQLLPSEDLPASARASTTAPAIESVAQPVAQVPEPLAPPSEALQPEPPPAKVERRVRASASTLVAERRLLAKAHGLLQANQSQHALEVLRVSEQRYPRSVLAQEREVLAVESLVAAGEHAAAERKAALFLERYPDSPHAGRVKRLIE